jgi:hypothetical protein
MSPLTGAVKGRWLWVAAGLAVIYGLVCLDVVLRCRHAYLEGERAASPREAYAWYESAATLFTPPESKWSRAARAKMPMARERWKSDLRARHIPFDDNMLN